MPTGKVGLGTSGSQHPTPRHGGRWEAFRARSPKSPEAKKACVVP